jgi:hypothetical protein
MRRALAATAAGTALAWLALGTQAAFPTELIGTRYWSGDFLSYYLPNAEYLGQRLARGELPLWDPRHAAGEPFLASLQAGALYPPNWLHALLPTQSVFVALTMLHLALAVIGTGAFAAALGADAFGAALAGLAYATSLRVMGEIWSPSAFYTSAWAGALWWAVERALARPGARSAVVLGASVALPLLAGWPYGVAIAALGAALYASLRLLEQALRERRVPLTALATLGAGVGVGAALAAPQLLPALELLRESCRALGSLREEQAVFVGAPHDPARFAQALWAHGFNDGIPGVVALALAPFALLRGPGRTRAGALLLVGALGLLASFPDHAPVYGWLRGLPVLGDFRFPYRYRLLTTLALAVAAGLGATRLLALCAARRTLGLALGCTALALQLAVATRPVWNALIPFPRAAPEARPLADMLDALGVHGDGRVLRAGWSGRLRASDRARVLNDLEPLSLARSAELLTFFESGQPRTVSRTTGPRVPAAGSGDALSAPYYGRIGLPDTPLRAGILDLLSVSVVVSSDPPAWLDSRYTRVGELPAGVAFTNPGALPRAYRVSAASLEPEGLQAALAKLIEPAFTAGRHVLLDALPPERPAPLERPAEGSVAIEVETPERIALRTRGAEPGIVVLTDAWFPGWVARVDGAEARVLRANLAFRAVAVPAGDHEIELRYRPHSLRSGALLAALAAFGCAVALRVSRGRSTPAP